MPLSPHAERNAIDGFCNRTLWPALHGLDGNVEQLDDWWRAYGDLSRRTAARLARFAPEQAMVWLHDYHFYGVPHHLRQIRPDLGIGIFCHTPFDDQTIRSIAPAACLARSLLASDFIGVQTEADASGMKRLLSSVSTALPAIHVDPVGIDTQQWIGYRSDPVVEALRDRHHRIRGVLAVGVDRLDYTKGIAHKLLAIETLLDSGSIDPATFRLIQIAVPTRTSIPIYEFLRDHIWDIERRINAAHPRPDGVPVVSIRHEQHSQREVAALYRAADLALVTPVRDGLNLVAVEFSVINQDRECELILGRGAGAHATLGTHCLSVDANDVIAIAACIRKALETDPRRRASSEQRGLVARTLDVSRWFSRCMAQFSTHSFSSPLPTDPSVPDLSQFGRHQSTPA